MLWTWQSFALWSDLPDLFYARDVGFQELGKRLAAEKPLATTYISPRGHGGFDLRFGYPLWKGWALSWSYGWDKTNLTEIDFTNVAQSILDSRDIEVTSSIKAGITKDTTNKFFSPTKGSKHRLETKYAGGPLGGDSYFTKFQGASSWNFPFFFK